MGLFNGFSAINRANKKLKTIEANVTELTQRLEQNTDTPLGFRCAFRQIQNDIQEFGSIIQESRISIGTCYFFMGNKFDPLQLAGFFKYILTEFDKEISERGG